MSSHRSLLVCLVIILTLLQSTEQFSITTNNTLINGRARISYYAFQNGLYVNPITIMVTIPMAFVITDADVASCTESASGVSAGCTVNSSNVVTINWPGSSIAAD